MVDWSSAIVVAITGIISVFAVLCLLSVTVIVTGKLFERKSKQRKSKQESAGARG
ncbi:MAG: hypothetical protein FH756_08565 [Firmicutes bacterium]|nr:hypothetical protein [Bacillota bacterium]